MPSVGNAKLTTAEVPIVPQRYRACARLANLPAPEGGWTRAKAVSALAILRASEIEKATCLRDLADWSDGTLNGIRGGTPQ